MRFLTFLIFALALIACGPQIQISNAYAQANLSDNEYSKCNPLIEKESVDFVTDIKVAHGLFVAHRDNRVSEYMSGKAKEGNSYGQIALGHMHLTGTYGAIKDKVKAIRWFSRAADNGSKAAECLLGLL